jgi:hypothetical protein
MTSLLDFLPIDGADSTSNTALGASLIGWRGSNVGAYLDSLSTTRVVSNITATSAGQTTFTVTGGYLVGQIDVFLNGFHLTNGVDYTATNGTTVVLQGTVLLASVSVNSILVVSALSAYSTANTVSASTLSGTGGAGLIGFEQPGTGAVLRTVQSKGQDVVSVKDFGATGNGTTDDTTAIQAAITYAQTSGQTVYMPAGTYLVTHSLNATSSGIPTHPVNIIGDGQNNTVINGVLVEAYPILDYTNNKRGSLKRLSITSTAASLDTCALLLAESAATVGALISIEDCGIASGSPTAWASMIGWCADQTLVRGSYFYATKKYGVIFGAQNLASVTSKFQTIALEAGDCTYSSFVQCNFLGQANAAFGFSGGDEISFTDCYYTVTGAGCAGIFDYDSDSYVGSLNMRGVRFENQSTYSGANCLNIKTTLQSAYLDGVFSSDAAAGIFGGSGQMTDVTLKANIGTSTTLFKNSSVMFNCDFDYIGGISTSLGTASSAASCYNLTFRGRGTLAAVQALFPNNPGIVVYSNSLLKYDSTTTAALFPAATAPTNWKRLSSGDSTYMTSTAYTGGSGLAVTASYAFNPQVLSFPVIGSFTRPYAELDIYGQVVTGIAAGTELEVQVVQGSNSLVLLTATSLLAGISGLKISLRFMMVGSTSLVCQVDLLNSPQTGGTPYAASNYVGAGTFSGASIAPGNGTMTINLLVSSPSSNPIASMTLTGKA